jgi:hypothetical protein
MELYEATYIICMLIVYIIRRTGSITFEEKVKILQFVSDLVLSLDNKRCNMYICDTKKMLV